MKKFFALLIAILVTLMSFTACNSKPSEKESITDGESETVIQTGKETQIQINNEDEKYENLDKSSLYFRKDKKIVFGSYPQTEVTDNTLKATLNSKVGILPTKTDSQMWTAYEYYINGEIADFMWYIDIEQGTEKFRGVYFMDYRPETPINFSAPENAYQDDNGYTKDHIYWFKYEPISWTVCSEDRAAGTAFLICDMIIDAQQFDYDGARDNNYAQSTIRKWLNEDFYDTAFSKLQKQVIATTVVDNGVSSTGYSANSYVCENTSDKIFLPSYVEVVNSSHGFSEDHKDYDVARQKTPTDYARVQGVYVDVTQDSLNSSVWQLRSPYYYDAGIARTVHSLGYISTSFSVYNTAMGVVPALQIKL